MSEIPSSPVPDADESLAEVLTILMRKLLRTGLKDGTPSIARRSFPAADWRYHIGAQGAEVNA